MSDISELNFDANNVEPMSFDPLPQGEYEAMITDSEVRDTKAGNAKYLNVTLQVISGEQEGRCLWDRLNLWNPSEKAVLMAQKTLASMCKAAGVMTPKDSAELHDIPMIVKVGLRKNDRTGDVENTVRAYLPLNGSASAAVVAPTEPVPPPQNRPSGPTPAVPSAQARPPAAVPPWKRK